MSLEIVILAAGDGKRMKSDLPKVLHPIAGKPMLAHVIETAMALEPEKIHVIAGIHTETIQQGLKKYWGKSVEKAKFHEFIHWIYQEKPLGTGHAVGCALPFFNPTNQVLVLFGDVPLISVETLRALQQKTADSLLYNSATGNKHLIDSALSLLLVNMAEPFGFGRVLRDDSKKILAIIEEKDANPEQKKIQEIFSGILLSTVNALSRWLPSLNCDNLQKEYYLTAIIEMAAKEGLLVQSVSASNLLEVQGVNDRSQLAQLERSHQESLAQKWLLNGVSILDPKRFDLRGTLECGKDTTIDINVVFEGENKIGKQCYIGPNCVIKNSILADNVRVEANSLLDGVTAAAHAEIGPFARLRPGTVLDHHAKVGNFVEMKKASMGAYSKASHLSYIGDATIGSQVNIGAGTITCNYNGVSKFHTIIEDGAFIGSDTQLVAPVRVGKNATIGAGSTIRKDAPAEQLTLSDARQKTISSWKRPVKHDEESD